MKIRKCLVDIQKSSIDSKAISEKIEKSGGSAQFLGECEWSEGVWEDPKRSWKGWHMLLQNYIL